MSELHPGDVLDGRYRIDGVLGEGGFAVVYRATDEMSRRVVALKVLSDDLLESSRTRARFEREIGVVAQLQSPHTVKLFGRGTTQSGAPYIVFELVPGRDLSEVLREVGTLEPGVVRHLLVQLLTALAEAHRAGIVHRDLKPANIRVFEYGEDLWRAKILDFGIALATRDEGPRLTADNELLGTPRYMSPEQLLGEPPGPASDIYALGVVAWELLVGADALHGSRWGDQLARLQSGFHFSHEDEGQDFGALADIIHRMTARSVERRFSNADAALAALAEAEAAPAPRSLSPPRTTEQRPPAPAPPTRVEARPTSSTANSNPVAAGVGVAGVLILLGVLLLVAWPNEPEPPPLTPTLRPSSALVASDSRDTSPEPAPPDLRVATMVEDAGPAAVADAAGSASSPGCGEDVFGTGQQASGTSEPGRRRLVHVPRGYDPNRPYPVVILVQTLVFPAEFMFNHLGFQQLADANGFVVMMFDKLNRLDAWEPADARFVFAELGTLASELCIDLDRVYVVAHGTGTLLGREIACRANIAGLALIGDIEKPGDARCEPTPVPVIRFAGMQDRYVPATGGSSCLGQEVRSLAAVESSWRATNRCAESARRWGKAKGGSCSAFACEGAPFVSCKLDGGHNFPNYPKVTELIQCGEDQPNTYPVTDAIWDFFEESVD